jgi:hypothetical protein
MTVVVGLPAKAKISALEVDTHAYFRKDLAIASGEPEQAPGFCVCTLFTIEAIR